MHTGKRAKARGKVHIGKRAIGDVMEEFSARELPRETEAHANAPAAALRLSHGRILKILLVEDHADTAAALVYLLRRWGHAVTHACDVESAMLAAGAQAFDLIISDIGLPDGSGLDVMRRVGRQGWDVRGIAISGRAMEEDLEKSRSAGFAEHLVKPISIEHLRAAIVRAAGVGIAAQAG